MAQTAPALPAGPGHAAAPLGVFAALGMGWRLMTSDFWALWLATFVLTLILMGVSSFGIVATILVQPPLMAGLYWLVARKMDGAPAKVGGIFEGFQQRFGQSVLAMLPLMLVNLAFVLVMIVMMIVGIALTTAGAAALAEGPHGDVEAAVVVVIGLVLGGGLVLVLCLAMLIVCLFFMFVLPAVWDHPESGWQAVRTSAGLVRGHFWSVVGLAILFALIGFAANLVGLALCFIGIFFTAPVVMIWEAAAITYLYRSWTGRPLAQLPAQGA